MQFPVNYTAREYQKAFWAHMHWGCRFAALVWHRRAGKDKTVFNFLLSRAISKVGIYYYLFPTFAQGKKIIWDGIDRDGPLISAHLPPQFIASRNETDMKLVLTNGSIIQIIGTDKYDSIRGTNPIGCVFSEYSEQDPGAWDVIQPILLENGGWAVFVYTPKGNNHSYELFQGAQGDPEWFTQILTIEDTGTMQREDVDKLIAKGMDRDFAAQEFYCSFTGAMAGAYYGHQMEQAQKDGRITTVPYEPRIPVNTAWDLGMDDAMAIWFYQRHGRERRFIRYFENSGEGLPYYIKFLKDQPYLYGTHFAPHDIEVRELGTGKSRKEIAQSLGLRFTPIKKMAIENGIEACRMVIPECWFDRDQCAEGLKALRNYSKEYDPTHKIFKARPIHDRWSNGADAFRTFAMGDRIGDDTERRRTVNEIDFDPFSYERRSRPMTDSFGTDRQSSNDFNPLTYEGEGYGLRR